jgi:hypothetical protein
VVTKVTCCGLDDWGLVPSRDMGFAFYHYLHGSSGHPAAYSVRARRLFPWGEVAGK